MPQAALSLARNVPPGGGAELREAAPGDVQLALATPGGLRVSVPKSLSGAWLLPENYMLVAADIAIEDAIEEVRFNGKAAIEVNGKYELVEYFPEGLTQLHVVVVTKTGITYVSSHDFVGPEDPGFKGVVADWIGGDPYW